MRPGGTGGLTGLIEFLWPVRVYYEDTDAGGVVYYANYLRFMERARTEWLRSLGFEQDRLIAEQGIVFAVRAVSLDYLKPARFNDTLQISVTLSDRGRASMSFAQEVRRCGDPVQTLARGQVRIACLDAGCLRPRPIPPGVLAELPDVG